MRLRPYARALRDRRNRYIDEFGAWLGGARKEKPQDALRTVIALWRRQAGKTTTLALLNLREMARYPGRLTIFASASLLVGGEIIHKQARLFRDIIGQFRVASAARITAETDGRHDLLGEDDDALASALESRRLCVKLWHDRTTCSRMQIVAPNPATARGFTGSVVLDEIGWIHDFRDVWEDAMEPILSSDPTFTCLMATTPPADDTHYSYEMLVPAPGTEFGVNPMGNWYISAAGLPVHRVDAWDGAAAGADFFSKKTGFRCSPEEHRAESTDRESWDRNYALRMTAGGTAAVSRLTMERAQSAGASRECIAVNATETRPADDVIFKAIAPGAEVGLGFDIATTTGQKSNYSSLTLAERAGKYVIHRVIWRWKEADAQAALSRLTPFVLGLTAHLGRSPRALCIDASSEVYFATLVRNALKDYCPVRLIRGNDAFVQNGANISAKQLLGDLYTSSLDDGLAVLPSVRWLFEDHRLVKKERGQYVADVGPDGCHADSFDSCKLAHFALASPNGAGVAAAFVRDDSDTGDVLRYAKGGLGL
jgi:hypothetical protein